MKNIISYLFETNAVRICPENSPFWYTSGKIGPYFINTHFLYGNESDAATLLSFIDEMLADRMALPEAVFSKVKKQYETNTIFQDVINEIVSYIKENLLVDEIDYISGGERRDWYFSNMVAHLLGKSHITIYKDLACYVSDCDFLHTEVITDLSGKKVLHVADLMNQSSSYIRAWIPAITALNATMSYSFCVVDRMQGGAETLIDAGVKPYSIIQIDTALFQAAVEKGMISEAQFDMVKKYIQDPDGTMRDFLISHSDFLENALHSDEKTVKRAKLLLDSNLYNL